MEIYSLHLKQCQLGPLANALPIGNIWSTCLIMFPVYMYLFLVIWDVQVSSGIKNMFFLTLYIYEEIKNNHIRISVAKEELFW